MNNGNDLFRTTISIKQSVYDKAEDLMAKRGSTFSGLLHQLIREEWERRHHDPAPVKPSRKKSPARN